jgi:hypothetical protein
MKAKSWICAPSRGGAWDDRETIYDTGMGLFFKRRVLAAVTTSAPSEGGFPLLRCPKSRLGQRSILARPIARKLPDLMELHRS